MNELNQLMMAARSVFGGMGGGGELAQDLGKIIERAQQAAYRSVDVMLVYRNWFIGKRFPILDTVCLKSGISCAS